MLEKQLENGEWHIICKQIGFDQTFKSLEEGRTELSKKFGGAK